MTESNNPNTTSNTGETAEPNYSKYSNDSATDRAADETGAEEVRSNLREAGDALLAAGSALGAAFGKAFEGLPDRVKSASDSARASLDNATTDGEVRSWATNFTNEAEKAFNSFRERDLKFTDDAKEGLRNRVADIRASFDERMDKVGSNAEGEETNVVADLRNRFNGLVDRIQSQFGEQGTATGTATDTVTDSATGTPADTAKRGDIIEGEVVADDAEDVFGSYRNNVTNPKDAN